MNHGIELMMRSGPVSLQEWLLYEKRLGGACQFEREDARWHGDYSIAQHHEDGGDKAAEDRVWRDITVAHSGNSDDGPVHCRRNARETVLLALDLIHHRANQDHSG